MSLEINNPPTGVGDPVVGGTSGSVVYIDANGNLAQDNANLFWDGTNHRLAIGKTNPSFPVDATVTFTAAQSGNQNLSNLVCFVNGPAESTFCTRGMSINTEKGGGNNLTSSLGVRGIQATIGNAGAGNCTEVAGMLMQVYNTGTGTVTNGYAFYAFAPNAAVPNPMTNSYAYYAATQAKAGVTAAYALYMAGTTDRNFIAGPLGVGLENTAYTFNVGNASGFATCAVNGSSAADFRFRHSAAGVDVKEILMRAQNGKTAWSSITDAGSFNKQNIIVMDHSTGFVGINLSPTAVLHIAAGTASANTAPLKINSGTNLSTAETGAIEYNGNFYLSNAGVIRFPVGGTLFDHFADAGNGTTVETDLYSDTTAANTLKNNGDKISATYGCTFVNSTSTKQVKLYFAGTAIFDSGALSISGSSEMTVSVLIIRDASTSVRYSVFANTTGASTGSYSSVGKLTGLTLSGTNIIKITGTAAGVGAATNDIVATLGTVEFKPAA